MKLAFIGLGNMGFPMSRNLVNAGYSVYGVNRSKQRENEFEKIGGFVGKTIKELANEMDVIMTCLPLPSDVEDVYLGEEGLITHGRENLVLIDFSTVSPNLNKKINNKAKVKKIEFLDAPISGGTIGANAGTLSIMVGGEKTTFDKVLPVFDILGENVYHVGDVGSGSSIKLLNQYMVSVHSQAVSEAFVLAEKAGINLELLHEILSVSYAQSKILTRHYTDFISVNNYQPGFELGLLHKDVTIVNEMAETYNVDLALGDKVVTQLSEALEAGLGKEDMSAMIKLVREKVK
ncbi:NAD(P)-dependent oxidoreductase [Metabacillus rhizolycopersici]|uniref:NAD(P)-dependent oxidoreductase n=1 Tax=Metabacillus rhizolycopersici TaxID=2875709 RepID=A0ABS7URD5_9BACI|nr:NAD(P)-dependent oxidoreductase [Metabacillus rhizolycopersici]MBZ5750701.1 NAD(P)-dependent oxidoreductase [Metabacillus rhizolycopersici]